MPMSERFQQRRQVRSFVRREGRMTDAHDLWPRYGLELANAPWEMSQCFGRTAPLTVEIGFGNGDHLAAAAIAHPERNYLGVEVHRPGVGRLLLQAEQHGITNLRVACADAVEVIRDALPPGSVDEIIIFFPDPWPKKRHHKRRLIQPEFAALLARALRSGGSLRLATDWADYAQHMLTVLDAEPQLINVAGAGGTVPRPADRALTRFETRGMKLGHRVSDFEYRRR
jgi:tRNA (guanine-N7-)-methyltransferase